MFGYGKWRDYAVISYRAYIALMVTRKFAVKTTVRGVPTSSYTQSLLDVAQLNAL